MATAKGTIAIIADDRVASTAEAITAAALAELVRQTKRQTALLEALVEKLHVSEATTVAEQPSAPAAAPQKPHRHIATSTTRSGSGSRKCSSRNASSSAIFTAEELRSRARAHNHLLDTESSKSRAILAMLRDDGSVPEHFPANVADFMELTSHQLHSLMRAYGLPDSNATIESQRAAFGHFLGLHKYCRG